MVKYKIEYLSIRIKYDKIAFFLKAAWLFRFDVNHY